MNFLSSLFYSLLLLSFFLYLKMVLYARDCSCTQTLIFSSKPQYMYINSREYREELHVYVYMHVFNDR